MELTALTALSPLDGRYGTKTVALRDFFSEYALIKYRVIVEIEWLKALANAPGIDEVLVLSREAIALLDGIADTFSVADAGRVKAIEATTNHDVKAVEYFLKEKRNRTPKSPRFPSSFTLPARRRTSTIFRMR